MQGSFDRMQVFFDRSFGPFEWSQALLIGFRGFFDRILGFLDGIQGFF